MKFINSFFLLFLVLSFFSCKKIINKTTNKEKIKQPSNKLIDIGFNSINKHSFIELTKTDSVNIFYKPCDASILKYKIVDSILYIRTHQDGNFNCKIKEINKINDTVLNIKYKYFDFNPALNLKFIKKQEYWMINNNIFIDSLYSKNIPYIKQNCEDFFD